MNVTQAVEEDAQEVILIRRISRASDKYGSLLLTFMDQYGLENLASASAEQLDEFIRKENIA